MKNQLFLRTFLIIFAISFTFIACNEQNSTETSVNKQIIPDVPVNPVGFYPSDRLYNTDHEWIKFENDTNATMGVTSYAIQLLGTTCSIDEEGDIPILIHRDTNEVNPFNEKRISLITGTSDSMDFFINFESYLYQKNPLIDSDPSIVSDDPYDAGWIYRLTVYDTTGGNFMNSLQYENYVNSL